MMNRLFLIPLIYLFVFVTGSAGLIYQVVWQKYLQRLLGSDNIATAIILGVFLGGLSIGYWLCGLLSARVRNHFRAYAILEFLIGAWCLVFPVFFDRIESLTASWSFQYPFWIIIQGLIASFILMGIPTVCMGATIPFLTRALTVRLAAATHVNSLVYAVNTAGAFVGVILAGFFLVPAYGLPLTIMSASLINIVVGLFFYGLAKYRANFNLEVPAPALDPLAEQEAVAPRCDIPLFALYATAFLSGFYVMSLENVLIRLSALSFGSSSYSFSLVVAIFIFCIALGSFAVNRLKVIRKGYLFINQLVIALGLTAIYFLLDLWPYFAHLIRAGFQSNIVGFWLYYLALFLGLFTLLILPVAMMGATLPLIFHNMRRDLATVGLHAGYIFSCNTLGSLLGSIIGGVLFFSVFDIPSVYLLSVILATLSAILLAPGLGRRYLIPACSLFLLVLFLAVWTPFYEKSHFRLGTFRNTQLTNVSLSGPEVFFREFSKTNLIYYRDGVTATVAVLEDLRVDSRGAKGKAIIVNGKSDSHTIGDACTLKLLAHLPLLLSPSARDILIIGLGTGVTAGEATLYPEIKQIDVAEMSAEVVLAQEHFRDFNRNLLADSRVQIHLGDALRIMERGEKKWDVIISEPSNPWTAGVDQLFTREFYQKAKLRMKENGIFVQWLHTYSADNMMLGLVFNSMVKEFPYVRAFVGNPQDILILASTTPLTAANVALAEKTLAANKPVADSLRELNINRMDSLLLREIMNDGDIKSRYDGFGQQTRDFPLLHYLAGKLFFMERFVPFETLLNADTAYHRENYLLVKKYQDRNRAPLDKASVDFILRDDSPGLPAAIIKSLKLKAWLNHNSSLEPAPQDIADFRADLISLTMRYPHQNDFRWPVGLAAGEYRLNISMLLANIEKTRNWISAYPLDGLLRLVDEGIRQGINAQEKNWCRLKQAQLMIKAKEPPERIEALLNQLLKDDQGKILLADGDEALLKVVTASLKKLRPLSGLPQ